MYRSLDYTVQREIEDIVVVKRSGLCPLLVLRIDRPRQQERDFLLTKAAMGTKAVTCQLAEIVIFLPGADNCLSIAEHCEIPFPVDRKFESLADRFLVDSQLNAGQRPRKRHHGLNIAGLSQMHPDE